MTTVKNIYDYINSIAPFDAQEEWDNSGHLVGDFRKEVKKCVMALDATKAVCAFAAEIGADMLLSHHPVIFRALKDIKADSEAYILAHAGISTVCAHTNFDVAQGGINDALAEILGLQNTRHLEEEPLVVVGELDAPMSMDDLAEFVSDRLNCAGIRYTDTERTICTVAVGGGDCEEFAALACANADVFVTGDMKYHPMLDAAEQGMAVISAGHYETEYAPFMRLMERLQKMFPDVEFIAAPQPNPIKTV